MSEEKLRGWGPTQRGEGELDPLLGGIAGCFTPFYWLLVGVLAICFCKGWVLGFMSKAV